MNTDTLNDIVATNTIEIAEGEYAPMPNAPRDYALPGPAKLKVDRYRDGRIAGQVLLGEVKPMRLAIHKKWKRLPWGV